MYSIHSSEKKLNENLLLPTTRNKTFSLLKVYYHEWVKIRLWTGVSLFRNGFNWFRTVSPYLGLSVCFQMVPSNASVHVRLHEKSFSFICNDIYSQNHFLHSIFAMTRFYKSRNMVLTGFLSVYKASKQFLNYVRESVLNLFLRFSVKWRLFSPYAFRVLHAFACLHPSGKRKIMTLDLWVSGTKELLIDSQTIVLGKKLEK